MHKYQQAAMSIAFLTVLLSAGISNGYLKLGDDQADSGSQAKQEAILETFENNDYDSWKKLVGRKNEIKNIISKEDFQKFVAARHIARAGGYDQAIELTRKLELDLKNRMGAELA